MSRVSHQKDTVELTLSLDSGTGYSAGDVFADTQELAGAVSYRGGHTTIKSVTALDKDDIGMAFDLVFLNANQSLGTENAAVSISDANAEKILTAVPISSSDYVDLVNSMLAVKHNVIAELEAASSTQSIYVGAIARGSGTFTANPIVIKFGLEE